MAHVAADRPVGESGRRPRQNESGQRIRLEPFQLLGRRQTTSLAQITDCRQAQPKPLTFELSEISPDALITLQKSRGDVITPAPTKITQITLTQKAARSDRYRNPSDVGLISGSSGEPEGSLPEPQQTLG
ncbi:hypothetical protein [Micromonospora sp. Llam0]|uniref:hypothetical protein n=1 Tax=Micromonospora sp. Llam0 TaxID=2485143 RepID=UPI001F444DD6|nr:hypothetical protein [Micromonospora sp. Llam0]